MKYGNLDLENFNYNLSKEKIALFPRKRREDSRLLIYKKGKIINSKFSDILNYLPKQSTIFFNNTRVIKSRFFFKNSKNDKIEIFITDYKKNRKKNIVEVNALIGNKKKWRDNEILFSKKKSILIEAFIKNEKIFFKWDKEIEWEQILETFGTLPLPPYIRREVEKEDNKTYQTVYSKIDGSVASPTAGLHFTDKIIDKIKKVHSVNFITLHIGIGTFKPIKEKKVFNHLMHAEKIIISRDIILKIQNSNNIVAIGTTSLRSIESIYYVGLKISKNESFTTIEQDIYINEKKIHNKEYICQLILNYMDEKKLSELEFFSSLFILPGYKFKFCDQIITNFHYPKSTLILLISSFIGEDWRKVYNFALENNYRFLSYGDSSLLYKK